METTFEYIVVEKRDCASIIRINRPDIRNKIGRDAVRELSAALHDADEDPCVKASILTGTGEYFCAGGAPDGLPDIYMEQREYSDATIDFQRAIYKAKKPVIAAVQGHAFAGGLTVVQGCDLAVAADDVLFGLPELHESYMFPAMAVGVNAKYFPQKVLMEIILLGRKLTAEEAIQYHVINKAVPHDQVLDAALEMAKVIGAQNTTSITIGKQSYYQCVNMNLEQAMEYSKLSLSCEIFTKDGLEAYLAKKEGRLPKYIGK